MKRVASVLAAAVVVAAVAASGARATTECRGLQVCVPVAGPWVVASSTAQVRYQLACPRRFVVAGLDAELSTRNVDIAFLGALGSPVNPGITTSSSALFLGRLLGRSAPAAFRPHIGCIPATGGGQRFPTAHHAFRPAKPLAPMAIQLAILAGVHRFSARCPAGKHLTGATAAVAFYTTTAPTAGLMRSVAVAQTMHGDGVTLVVRARAVPARTIVQIDLDCAAAA